jgi:hypothetical protein
MNTPPPAVPRKKSGRGCLIALAIVGGAGVLVVALVAFAIYRFASSKEGKAVLGAIGDMAQLAQEAQNAPGAKEVRALGCDQAMAMDVDRMQQILDERLDAAPSKPSSFSMMVVCQVGVFAKSPPSCDDVARAYLSAAPKPARGFAANVQRNGGGNHPLCSVLYDPDGVKVKDLAPGSTPAVPGTK